MSLIECAITNEPVSALPFDGPMGSLEVADAEVESLAEADDATSPQEPGKGIREVAAGDPSRSQSRPIDSLY